MEIDFIIDEKNCVILIIEEGIKKVENFFGVDNLYKIENVVLLYYLD